MNGRIGADQGIGVHTGDLAENIVVMQIGVGISARIGHGARIGHIIPRGPRGFVSAPVAVAACILPAVVEVSETETRPNPTAKTAPLARMVVMAAMLVVVRASVLGIADAARSLVTRVGRFVVSLEGRATIGTYLVMGALAVYTAQRLTMIFSN